MTTAKKRRLNRLFAPDGRCLVVAMDHAGFMDKPLKGLGTPAETIRAVTHAGADAILITLGSALACSEAIGRAGLWLSVDVQPSFTERAVETALRIGADGIKCMFYPWCAEQSNSQAVLAALAADCYAWGLPLMAEVIPGGFGAGEGMRSPQQIAAGARVAIEAGADVIKTFYTGDADSFRQVLNYCPAPVIVLGGERAANDDGLLAGVRAALEAGAAGVAIGRNIWQHAQPAAIAALLRQAVHDEG
jgi:DhnA family fructose-bisphosphate aldolase class Ia